MVDKRLVLERRRLGAINKVKFSVVMQDDATAKRSLLLKTTAFFIDSYLRLTSNKTSQLYNLTKQNYKSIWKSGV